MSSHVVLSSLNLRRSHIWDCKSGSNNSWGGYSSKGIETDTVEVLGPF